MRLLGIALTVLMLVGCAKLPPGGGGSTGPRLVITMYLDAELNENFVYMFPLRVSTDPNPTDQGPIPVIDPPWGNGYVGGNATHFIRYEPHRPFPFVLYRFNDPTLLNFTEIGIIEVFDPIPVDDPQNDDQLERKRFRFEVEVNELADSPAQAALLETVQFNFLTMTQQGTGSSQRPWDALGNGVIEINSWITASLRTALIHDNDMYNLIEPLAPDVIDPSLDIRDWSVEIRLQ